MPTTVQCPILIRSGEAVSDGILYLHEYAPRERLLRALKAWGLFWLAMVGIAFTFIPVVHVVLAITFFILGPVIAYKRYRTVLSPDRVSGICPVHSSDFMIELESAARLPMWAYCPNCNAPLQLLEKEGFTAA